TNESVPYDELTSGQKLVKVVETAPALTPAAQWNVAGQPAPKVDGESFVTGAHQYTPDIVREGMLYGKILRPSGFKAQLVSFDDSARSRFPHVTVVRDGDFIGVAAPDLWSAEQALGALKAQWKTPQQISDRELFTYLKSNADKSETEAPQVTGSVAKARA